jgi:predicted phage gp36 major capsid-like protein
MVSWFNSWAANLPWTCHAENTSAWRACQSQKWKENTKENRKSAENTKRKCKVQKKKAEQIRKYVKKSGKEKDEKEQERIPKRCSAVQSSRRNNGTMETQDLARLGELPMALASLRNFCPSMNLGHLSALPGQT